MIFVRFACPHPGARHEHHHSRRPWRHRRAAVRPSSPSSPARTSTATAESNADLRSTGPGLTAGAFSLRILIAQNPKQATISISMEQDTIELPQPQETILVVEDEVLVRMPISQYLRDCRYRVIEAANAQEAVTVLSHEETFVDVVFTDIEMPGALDGFGLAKWVREHRPGVEVILAGTLPSTVRQAEELCEEGLLPKPYDAQAVHDQIRRLLAARKAAEPSD